MKYLKYIFLFLLGVLVVTAAGYYIFQMKKGETVTIVPPATIVATITKKTSNFSLEEAPSESLRGEITSMTGDVTFLGRTATEAAKLASGSGVVQQGENYITGDKSTLSINFDKAISIDMLEKTEVDIIQTLPATIVFSQVAGTADYKMATSSSVAIRTSYLLTQLNGEAVISRNPDKPIVTVNMKSGNAVLAYNDLKFVSHEVMILGGHNFTFNYGTRRGVLK